MNRIDSHLTTERPASDNGHAIAPIIETSRDVAEAVDRMQEQVLELRRQLAGVIVGQAEVSEQLLIAMLCRGHCILQGMPGLAKTMLVSTMASLIEKEAKVDKDRELISQVYHKRLKMGMNLACDPTVIYGAILAGKYKWNGTIYQSDLDRDSPYNTYKKPGMPPGPIASPGKRAIEAALHPASTDYLFFVVDGVKRDGSHVFSTSGADHARAVSAYRQMEREQK